MGMRIMVGLLPILVVVVFWVTSKPSQFLPSTMLFGSPHFMFSVFNSIILLITMRNHEPQVPHEQFELMELILQSPYHHKPHEQDIEFRARDHCEDTREEKDVDENVGCGEDDNDEEEIKELNEKEDGDRDSDCDDNGNEAAEGWDEEEEEEEEDEELEKRIEEFIAKVNKRWREEKLRDHHFLIQLCSTTT